MTDDPRPTTDELASTYEVDDYEKTWMPGDVLMRERLSMAPLLRWGIPGFLVAMAILQLVIIPVWAVAIPVALFMVLLAVLVSSMTTIRTSVTPDTLHIQTGVFGPKIAVKDIELCEATHYDALREYGGWGIRYGRDGTVCYNMTGDKGKGVRIHYKTPDGKQKKLLFSSLHHHTFAEAINKARRDLGHDIPDTLLPTDEAIGLVDPYAQLADADAPGLAEVEVPEEATTPQK